MGLMSLALRGEPKLEACFISDAAHITLGARGPHVGKIQKALIIGGSKVIGQAELSAEWYGPQTAASVLRFKEDRQIVNRSYQSKPDAIVGKQTIGALDLVMLTLEDPNLIPDASLFPERGHAAAVHESPAALARIKSAEARLKMALAARKAGLTTDLNLRSANWHFKVNRARDPLAQLTYVHSIYANMARVLNISILSGGRTLFGNFRDPSVSGPDELGTVAGGFSYSDQEAIARMNADPQAEDPRIICVSPQTVMTPTRICHELAHYCGGRLHSRHAILDSVVSFPLGIGRALRGVHNYAQMTAHEAASNVFSYEYFCFPDQLFGRTPPNAPD